MREIRDLLADKLLEIVLLQIALTLALGAVMVWIGNQPVMLLLAAGVAVLAACLYLALRRLRARTRAPRIGDETAFQVARRGVVFTLGLHSAEPDSVVFQVVRRLQPEWVGFLGTPETERLGLPAALVRALSLPPERVKSEAWDPTHLREGAVKTGLVLDWLLEQDLSPREIVLDLTAGTSTMSIAAFLAAQQRRVDSQYLHSEWDRDQKRFVPGSQRPILVTHYPD